MQQIGVGRKRKEEERRGMSHNQSALKKNK